MALKKKKKIEEPAITTDEVGAVSVDKTQVVVSHLQDKFNLKNKNFVLSGYADKGNKIITTLSNEDYDVTVTVKSPDLLYVFDSIANNREEAEPAAEEESEDE